MKKSQPLISKTPEDLRLYEDKTGKNKWKKWGPYVSERQWGTVREDYSADGDAWNYVTHDKAYSVAYRWGEDGIGGFSDDQQLICLSVAFWNGQDPILKERFFGLANNEGNHGEDGKELYYYLDSTPTHSYMKMLYKYPQYEYPYEKLVNENRLRGYDQPEFEIMDTGIYQDNRYFDLFIEYAKGDTDDILMQLSAINRGHESAELHILIQVTLRNTWSWELESQKPQMRSPGKNVIDIRHPHIGDYKFYSDQGEIIFCNNETNRKRIFQEENTKGPFKDAFHEYVIHSRKEAISNEGIGTKGAFYSKCKIEGSGKSLLQTRLTKNRIADPFGDFDNILQLRKKEADIFYAGLQKNIADEEKKSIQRQALAGMLWNKQYYYYDIPQWLTGDPDHPAPPVSDKSRRNSEWFHLNNADIISMPDKWEYPWYAAWDLAFHCLSMALIDPEFAKSQLLLITREWYMHPSGQFPAYEWNFSDVNPPVHAWATWRVYQIDRNLNNGKGDKAFLERVFHKLLLNFTWWVNRKDTQGRNIFQGGFLGLDNIGVFDRSAPLPTGGYINQADGTAWMAMYCLNLMRIALELARENHIYEDIASKFFEHFLYIAQAMTNIGGKDIGLWDEEDEFYYDVLNLPNGEMNTLRVRSMVGLVPLFAVETLEPVLLKEVPEFTRRMEWFLKYRPDLAQLVSYWEVEGQGRRRLLSLLRGHRMKCLLRRMFDEKEFYSDYGVRALSKYHQEHPYSYQTENCSLNVTYLPGESDSGMFGGNSNWRGPIWFPMNYLIIESLQKFHHYYGDEFLIEYPTGSGQMKTILNASQDLSQRLIKIFLKNESNKRPVFGNQEQMQRDRHFNDFLLFYEYFHGDNGQGLGASHQTGWTGLIAKLLQPRHE